MRTALLRPIPRDTYHTREVPQCGTDKTRQIPLSKGFFALIDSADFEKVSSRKWCAMERRKSGEYQAITKIDGHKVLMHRYILDITDARQIDHRNHDALDNRRSNLRICTPGENSHNSRKRSPHKASSQFKGVYWHKTKQRWRACIVVNYAKIGLGEYRNELDAARAYDSAALKHFGEFAHTNFRRTA